jgi:hypothetical protein
MARGTTKGNGNIRANQIEATFPCGNRSILKFQIRMIIRFVQSKHMFLNREASDFQGTESISLQMMHIFLPVLDCTPINRLSFKEAFWELLRRRPIEKISIKLVELVSAVGGHCLVNRLTEAQWHDNPLEVLTLIYELHSTIQHPKMHGRETIADLYRFQTAS